MKLGLFCYLALLCVLARPATAQSSKLPDAANMQVDFTRDVKPILQANCYSCHGPSQQLSGLRLDIKVPALRGGDSGVVIIPGNGAQSKILRRLTGSELGLQMPPTGALSAEEIGVLKAWIDQGATWPDATVEETAPPEKTGPLDPKGEPLFGAIHDGNSGAVRAILRKDRPLVNVRGNGGTTPLMYAALHAGEDCMRWLLDQGADPNARNRAGATALMWAAGDFDKVGLLLARKAQVNVASENGRTPLMIAARHEGAAAVVSLLLEKGADVNAQDNQGTNALMQAATAGDVETLKVLLAKSADINARATSGATALMAAARFGCLSCVELLIAHGAEVNAATKRGLTALATAAPFGESAIFRRLLEKGADVNAKDDRGYSPLMLAAYSDFLNTETVKALLDTGADVNVRGNDGETALSLAQKRGYTAVVQLLLNRDPKGTESTATVRERQEVQK